MNEVIFFVKKINCWPESFIKIKFSSARFPAIVNIFLDNNHQISREVARSNNKNFKVEFVEKKLLAGTGIAAEFQTYSSVVFS